MHLGHTNSVLIQLVSCGVLWSRSKENNRAQSLRIKGRQLYKQLREDQHRQKSVFKMEKKDKGLQLFSCCISDFLFSILMLWWVKICTLVSPRTIQDRFFWLCNTVVVQNVPYYLDPEKINSNPSHWSITVCPLGVRIELKVDRCHISFKEKHTSTNIAYSNFIILFISYFCH